MAPGRKNAAVPATAAATVAAAAVVAVAVALWAVALAAAASATFSRSYDNCATLSAANNITIRWTVNGSYVYIGIAGPAAKGYVAAGFDTSGNMTGKPTGFAEIWIVRSKQRVPKTRTFNPQRA